MKFLAIGTMLVAACTKPLPVVPPLDPTHSKIADAKTSSEPPSVATNQNAPAIEAQPPMPIPDARCEVLRLENERKAREFEASLPAGPEANKKALVKQLLETLRPCVSGLHSVWGLSFVWPPPLMALEANPPRGMDPMAWDQHPIASNRSRKRRQRHPASMRKGRCGRAYCVFTASKNGRATQSDRTAVPILVFEQTFALQELVDLDHDGNDELVVRQGLCLESCFDWLDIWSFAGGRLIPFGPAQAMNIVAIGDFDEDGKEVRSGNWPRSSPALHKANMRHGSSSKPIRTFCSAPSCSKWRRRDCPRRRWRFIGYRASLRTQRVPCSTSA